ncbi:splicing factor 3B subunit 1-like [Dorcoceras hygrometricum]|uniref:Splicing factor 3B subunit 1-like n=1 Tax=Dorcoceras hygrometricum TaxID=472368 RepID=A0A2Z7B538_9LAMI|nr:splicing factor 3B subunit 1-like [Dorcoceras hygrometricum]
MRSAEIDIEGSERSTAVNDEDDNLDGAENEISRKMASFTASKQFLKEPLRSGEDDDMSGLKKPIKLIEMEKEKESEKDKEIEPVDLSLAKNVATMTDSEDTEPLSKVLELTDNLTTEVTRINFGRGIEIAKVNEGDWYKASLPQIDTSNKGKPREMLLRKFLEAHRQNFKAGQPTTAIDLQIIALLSDAHLFALERIWFLKQGMRSHMMAGSFNAVTHERFLMMSSIHGGVQVNWRSTAVNDEDDNLDGAENEISRKMASFTASKQFLKEPLRSGEDDDMSGLKKPIKLIEMEKEKESEKDKEIEPVDLSLAKNVATMTDSEDTEPLSKPVGSHNFCGDIVAVGSVVDLTVDPEAFVGVFCRDPDVQVITSDSSSSYSSIQSDPISPNDSFFQRHLDTALTSPNPSICTDSRMLFTTDDIPLGDKTAVDQILIPTTADVTPQDISKPLAQLLASVNQIQIERVQKMDDAEKLKDVLLLHIRGLEQRFTEILEQEDRTYRGTSGNQAGPSGRSAGRSPRP